jgi:hypothetical protein
MAAEAILNKFFGLFRGNRDFYVVHKAPFTTGADGKTKASKCYFAKDRETGDFLPVTKQLYRDHLNGADGLAVSPLCNSADALNVCFHAAIDIDSYGNDYALLVRKMYSHGLKFSAFRSKSGGLHIYFMFDSPEPGADVIKTLKRIVDVFALKKVYASSDGVGKAEIFPKQAAYVPGETRSNCLFLPFYDSANGSSQNMLTAEGKLLPITKAMPHIEGMITSVKELNKTLDALPYSDAPFCVQTALLGGALGENSGRNDFLFTTALYLKLKSPDDVQEELLKANSLIDAPLDDRDVERIAESAMKGNYQIWGRCKTAVCERYCDRKTCRTREFGVGRQKNNKVSNVEFGKIFRMLAEEPYYLWEARLAGTEDYVKTRIDGEADLLNQKVVQKACIRYLNQTPVTVSQTVWEKTLNECLAGIEEIEVAEGTDTTETSALRECFMRFLTHKQTKHGQPYLVRAGHVYREDGVCYFTSDGVKQYLAMEKFSLRGYNLREQLIAYGCSEGELKYRTPRGTERVVKCWKKAEDEELSELGAFYEDIYEGDADIARANPVGDAEDGEALF